MQKSDRTAAGCTVEDEPYKLLARDAEKSIAVGPLRRPSEQIPFPLSLKAPVPVSHAALTVPVMFGPNITGYTGAAWDDTSGDVTGAFYFSGDAAESANGLRGRYGISFDASRVNSAYSRSRTVQPASVRSLYCIKS